MTIPSAPFPRRSLTVADLEDLPEDGRRYELVDGVLVVSPVPGTAHQRAVGRLCLRLAEDCPDTAEVFLGPLDIRLGGDTVLRPDILVVRAADLEDHGLSVPPLLALEVLSPSTRLFDLHLKRVRYEVAGCPSYWVVEPDEPSITAWELRDGVYEQAGHAAGAETLHLDQPYPFDITPATLVGPRRRREGDGNEPGAVARGGAR